MTWTFSNALIIDKVKYKSLHVQWWIQTRAKDGGVGGLDFLALLAFSPSVISSFFTQIKEGGVRAPRALS